MWAAGNGATAVDGSGVVELLLGSSNAGKLVVVIETCQMDILALELWSDFLGVRVLEGQHTRTSCVGKGWTNSIAFNIVFAQR